MIGDEIEVSVLAVTGEKVRLGIEAPRAVPVYRKEVYVEMQGASGPAQGAPDADEAAAARPGKSVDEALNRLKSGE